MTDAVSIGIINSLRSEIASLRRQIQRLKDELSAVRRAEADGMQRRAARKAADALIGLDCGND